MYKLKTKTLMFTGVLCIFFSFSSEIIAQDKAIKMGYSRETGKKRNYTLSSKGMSEMDVGGQFIMSTESTSGEIVYSLGKAKSGVLTHELSFAKLSASAENDMTGIISVDASQTIGKVLKMETGLHGENMKILNIKDIPAVPDSPFPLILSAIDILPELSSKPVKINDKWKVSNNRTIDANEGLIKITENIDFEFLGLEEKMGFECMKIVANNSGKMTGSSLMQGQDVQYEGVYQNKATYYFAYDEGLMIEVIIEGAMNMSLSMAALPEPMAIQQTGTVTISYVK